METKNLSLVALTPEQLRTLMTGAELYEQRYGLRMADGLRDFMVSGEVSPDFLAQLQTATEAGNMALPWCIGPTTS
jgi:hypothetical protein